MTDPAEDAGRVQQHVGVRSPTNYASSADLRILLERCVSREPGSLPNGQLRTTITYYLRRHPSR